MSVRFGDLAIESAIDLPALSHSTEAPGCRIRLGAPGLPLYEDQRWDHHWRTPVGDIVLSCGRDGDDYRLGVPWLATFVIRDGATLVECRPEMDLPPETLEHLLVDQVLPRVLTHRGRLVIHAGCVALPGGAVGFLGNSGAGKSTLCAAFARGGDPILGDDGIVLARAGEFGFHAMATYPGLRLFPEPVERILGRATASTAVAHTTEKRRIGLSEGAARAVAGPVPLIALYVLAAPEDNASGAQLSIRRATPRDALVTLLRGSFQLHLDDPERSREQLDRIAALADTVPVSVLRYPRELSRLPEVIEAIRADVLALTPASSAGSACS